MVHGKAFKQQHDTHGYQHKNRVRLQEAYD